MNSPSTRPSWRTLVPKTETEDEARRRNWIERGWAPWEEVLTPEVDSARKSLYKDEEVPLQSPEAIEAFKMLSPKYRKEKMEDMLSPQLFALSVLAFLYCYLLFGMPLAKTNLLFRFVKGR